MTEVDLFTIEAGEIDETTGAPMCKASRGTGEDREPYGRIPMIGTLGVSSLPADPGEGDDPGYAEGVCVEGIGGLAACVAGRDDRSSAVIAQLGAGETCLHSTGEDFNSRVFCKNNSVSIVVADNVIVNIDGLGKKIQIAGFGHIWEMSEANGISMAEKGGAALILKDGNAILKGKAVFLGENPTSPVAHGATPANLLSTSILVPIA